MEEFANLLASIISQKVLDQLRQDMEADKELHLWVNRYGLTMTREEVAEALKVSKRTVTNLEDRGDIDRVAIDGKQVRYSTAKIYQLATNKQS